MIDDDQRISAIAIFAHNEERSITACLESLREAGLPENTPVYVLANGCTDATIAVARTYSAMHPQVLVQEIAKGDKSNAWNVFVHELAPETGVCLFMDGDVRAGMNAAELLRQALSGEKDALVASAVPGSGRHREQQVRDVIAEHGVQGNLYAVRCALLMRIRQAKIRLPVGFIREDGLVGALAKFDLDPLANPWNDRRVAVEAKARFFFDPVPVISLRGWRLYLRRRVRYSLGHFENLMLRDVLLTEGIHAIPDTVSDLYRRFDLPKLRWRGLNTIFDWLALRRIRVLRAAAPIST